MDDQLPAHLASRCQWVRNPEATAHHPGEMVLYWMHNAIRGHENPALDVAITWAQQNGLPLLVYHGLSENYPFASDRHHAFILQAARDVQRELTQQGIRYAFHLERPRHRGPHLRDLVRRAAVMVTEEMPLPPITSWLERLRSITSTPIATVDTSCVLTGTALEPIKAASGVDLFECPHDYREATQSAYEELVSRTYEELPIDRDVLASTLAFDGPLPFKPLDLQDQDLARLIASCQIDHTVAPLAETPGGSRFGYRRWQSFRDQAIDDYEIRRDNACDAGGCSRLSAYLHYGMVSPFRIAREAAAADARAFLSDMLVWREMSFHFCAVRHEHLESTEALPDWANETLRDHVRDARPQTLDWESLARGRTEDPLWNTAQRSLIKHGELHHRVRMEWGKSFLSMTTTPEQAMNRCIDLNHRYALDGRSPNSYGGILWCFGQFDQPIEPAASVYGRVRPRERASDQPSPNPVDLATRVDRPIAAQLPRVAIIGAGLAGLVCGRTLSDHGIAIQLFEKSRGPGGRLATRRGDGSKQFDHGAQYFTVRDDVFARHVRSWMDVGLVQPWMGRIVELQDGGQTVLDKKGTSRYVGVPGNNAIAKHLAHDLNIVTQTQVARIDHRDDQWDLIDQHGQLLGSFDVVIVNAPPIQAADLLRPHTPLVSQIDQVRMHPCWTVMLQAEGLGDLPFAGAFINEGPLSWIARNDVKPSRLSPASIAGESDAASNWVLHASSAWSTEHLERDADEVTDRLLDAFSSATGVAMGTVHHRVAHRWRYSIPSVPLDDGCLWDAGRGLGACGDWCSGSRVEGAFVSGTAMAGTILRQVTIDRAPASEEITRPTS